MQPSRRSLTRMEPRSTATATAHYVFVYGHGSLVSNLVCTGPANLNLDGLKARFLAQTYAEHAARKEDYCCPDSSAFIDWLIARNWVTPVATTRVIEVDFYSPDRTPYAPPHWELCPECGVGRGAPVYGLPERALNRSEVCCKCSSCQHVWGHHYEPLDDSRPMEDDVGQMLDAGCVPYTLGRICNEPFWEKVLPLCEAHGWRPGYGMDGDRAIELAQRHLGVRFVPVSIADSGHTLGRTRARLSSDETYVIAVREHWLAMVRGQAFDLDDCSPRTRVKQVWRIEEIAGERLHLSGNLE